MTVLRRGLPQSEVVSSGRESLSRSGIAGSPVLLGPRPSPFVSCYFVVVGVDSVSAAHRYPTSSRATATTILVGCLPRRSICR